MAKSDQEPWHCLTVHQPWAWAIVTGAKDVENRTWPSRFKGRLHIQAGLKKPDDDEVEDVIRRVAKHLRIPVAAAREDYQRLAEHGFGAIIGSVHMRGCAWNWDSEWYDEELYGFVLTEAQRFDTPIPCKGRRRIFRFGPPDDA